MSNLEQQIEALGADCEELDSIVHDAASKIASKVNNEGMTSQIRFLKNEFNMTDKQILDAVKSELEGDGVITCAHCDNESIGSCQEC